MTTNVFHKDPQAVLDYDIDLAALTNGTGTSNWLQTGETISTRTWDVPAGITKVSDSVTLSNTNLKIWLSGGTDGTTYALTCHVTTSAAREQDFTLIIQVANFTGEWTYTGDPAYSTRDEVRFLVGDTDSSDKQVTDFEIAYAITQGGSARGAAVLIAKALASKYARLADRSIGDLSISYSQRVKNYLDMAQRLEKELAAGYGAILDVYAGGISIADKDTVEEDEDRVWPGLGIGMHDAPGTGTRTWAIVEEP